jgi:hypothetical protein
MCLSTNLPDLFNLYDKDSKGKLTPAQVAELVASSAVSSILSYSISFAVFLENFCAVLLACVHPWCFSMLISCSVPQRGLSQLSKAFGDSPTTLGKLANS